MAKNITLKEALKTERLTPFGNAVAGAMGAVVSSALVYPLDTVKTRIQGSSTDSSVTKSTGSDRKSKNAILAVLLKTWKNEGLEGFFRGFGANMISTFSMQFAYFFFHSSLRTAVLKRRTSKSLSTSLELLLGALAGALAQIFTIPVAVIATRQQLYERTKGSPETRDPSMFDTARDIIEESGVTGLWTGLKPGLVLTVNPAITYGVFEKLKGMVLAAAAVRAAGASGDEEVAKALNLGPGWSFLLGMTSKTLATVVTYPYIFAKVRLQAKSPKINSTASPSTSEQEPPTTTSLSPPGSFADVVKHEPAHQHGDHLVTSTDLEANKAEASSSTPHVTGETEQGASKVPVEKKKFTSAVELLQYTYAKHGFKGWYQGMSAQILKAVLSQGILFMLKDQFEKYALVLMILARRALARR
ncbi:hypothetical protein FFLO_01853 [Filobasidium floriforme]|uniref:Adenine nucleotide transporter n=1 Tax=Filobasidium floriforme TaxID=5210 RepID=A0A8K0JQ91_9TREE|nr:hypothetical protein FFLO_01853 [Filobasidium floriforme]